MEKYNQGNISKKHDRLFSAILFAEFWEMFSFFGLVSIIILYTTELFSNNDEVSYVIYSEYMTLFCGLPVIGGLICDKYFNSFISLILGSLLLITGNVFLVFGSNKLIFFVGLTTTICGAALFKPTSTSLVGKLISNKSKIEQENAYSKFYIVLNIGAMLSSIIYGIIYSYWGFQYCFLIGAIGCCCSFILVFLIRNDLLDSSYVFTPKRYLKGFSLMALMFSSILVIFFYSEHFDKFVLILSLISILIFGHIFKKQEKIGKRNLMGLIFLLSFCMVFFTASLQVGSTITMYIDTFVQRQVYLWVIPTSFFTFLNPLFLVLSGPLFDYVWRILSQKNKEPNIVLKLSLGLILGGVGFVFFWLSSMNFIMNDHKIAFIVIILGYLFLGAGEICISPAILNALSTYSPQALKSTMMGAWYLFMAFSGYLGGFIDTIIIKYTHSTPHQEIFKQKLIDLQYSFEIYFLVCTGIGIALFLISRKVNWFFFEEYCNTGARCKISWVRKIASSPVLIKKA